jgi:uncharacterized membrane-anchored protein YhcB (DUF1043 family)
MNNAQLYFAIAVPVFAVIMGVLINNFNTSWHARGVEKRIDGLEKRIDSLEARFEARFDRIDRTLEVIQNDLKQFYTDIARLKERTGL